MKYFLLLAGAYSWTYSNQGSWPSDCSKSTSPIALDPSLSKKISSSDSMKIVFLGATGIQTIENAENMIKITSPLGYIEVGDSKKRRVFNVEHIEFHTPSEHKIGGTFFPMEIQIVCSIMDRYWERDMPNLAIVSVILKYGIESYFFNTLEVWSLPKKAKTHELSASSNINLRELVKNTDSYWFYNGSATNPDLNCQENVMRYIIQDVKEAARWQIDAFSTLINDNTKDLSSSTPSLYHSNSFLLLPSLLLLSL